MTAEPFRCQLVTPTEKLLDDRATYASVPAWDGLFGVLPNRAPIVARLGVGRLRVHFADRDGAKGGERSYFVQNGFVQMVGNALTVLADHAVPVEQISLTDAEAELAEIQARTVPADAPNRRAELDRLAAARKAAATKVRLARESAGKAI